MHELLSGICDRALAPAGGAPEWVQLFNNGVETGRDGRTFELADPAALVLAFQSAALNLPIDYEHQNDRPEARLSGPVPAAGWIKELKADDSGLWGRVEWTATASEMISKREYHYISPSFLYHPKTLHIVRLKGVGLVHNPNLHLAALASQDTPMPPVAGATTPTLPGLMASLGLASDASAEDILRAVLTLLKGALPPASLTATMAQLLPEVAPDPAKYVPVSALSDLLRDRNTKLATMAERDATPRVQDALQRGFITPAMKPWATALCTQDPESFDGFLAKSVPAYDHLTKSQSHMSLAPAHLDTPAESAAADAICQQLGLPPGSLKA